MRDLIRFLILIVGCSLFNASPALPQEIEPAGRFGGEVEVTVVNLDVWVRDKDDQPVYGLDLNDFDVIENGIGVEISHFFEVRAPEFEVERSQPVDSVISRTEAEPVEQSRLVLLVDDENIHPNRRNLALDSLGPFLTDEKNSQVRVTVLRSSKGLKWVLDDSIDPNEVQTALDSLRGRTGGAVFHDADFRAMVLDVRNASRFTEARALVRQYARQQQISARATFNALAAAVTVLSGDSARTTLLYIGGGFPVDPGGDAFRVLENAYPGNGVLTGVSEYQLRPELNHLVEQANSAGVTVSAFDSQGLNVNSAAGVDGPMGLGSVQGFNLDSLRRSSRQASLAALTVETGGTFARTANSITGLLDVVRNDLTAYYSIGFESRVIDADQHRAIKVKVKRPSVTVRHKSGFTARGESERRADETLAALFLEPQGNPLELGVRLLDAEKKSRRRYLVPIDVLIPVKNLVALPSENGPDVRLEMLFASCDKHGTVSPIQRLEVGGPLPETTGSKVPVFRHRVTLQLPPGEHRVAVTVHDVVGGATASVAGSLTIP